MSTGSNPSGRPAIGGKIGVRISEDQRDRLDEWASRHGMTRNAAIRLAIESMLAADVGKRILRDDTSGHAHLIARSSRPEVWRRALERGQVVSSDSENLGRPGRDWSLRLVRYTPPDGGVWYAVSSRDRDRWMIYDFPCFEDAEFTYTEWLKVHSQQRAREAEDYLARLGRR